MAQLITCTNQIPKHLVTQWLDQWANAELVLLWHNLLESILWMGQGKLPARRDLTTGRAHIKPYRASLFLPSPHLLCIALSNSNTAEPSNRPGAAAHQITRLSYWLRKLCRATGGFFSAADASPHEKSRKDVAAQVLSRDNPLSSRLIDRSRSHLADTIITRNEAKVSSYQ